MVEDDTNLLDPDDDKEGEGEPQSFDRSDALPELPAPPPRSGRNEPAQAPIRLSDLDVMHAKELLVAPLDLSVSVFPGIGREEVEALIGATIDRVRTRATSGSEENLSVTELADVAGLPRGKIGERFSATLPQFADLAVRGIHAQAGLRVYYEQLESNRAKTGRRHNGEGTEKVQGIADNQLHLLTCSLATSNRHCPATSRILNMGTRWSRSNERFGVGFPDWALEYQGPLPDTFADHMKLMLDEDRAMRAAVVQAIKDGKAVFSGSLTDRRLLATISQFLLIPLIPYGTSFIPYRSHADVFRPGRDEATIAEAVASKRHVVLACGQPSPAERLEFEDGSEGLVVGRLPSMYELDIHKNHEVEYRWSPRRHELGRYSAGRGSRLDIWRLVGYDDEESFWRMLSLAERHAQVTWTKICTGRWEEDCMPGRQKAHVPEHCAGVRALLKVANAAIVDSLRRRGLEGV